MSPPTTLRLALVALVPLVAAATNNATNASSASPSAAINITVAIEACRKGGRLNLTAGVFDAHLHLTGRTPTQSGADLTAELDEAGVDEGLLYSVYGPADNDGELADANEEVARIISSGGKGRILGERYSPATLSSSSKKQLKLKRCSVSIKVYCQTVRR